MWATIAKTGFGYLKSSLDAKAQREWDKYNNRMVGIQAAQAQNSITENVEANRRQHAQNKIDINISRMMATAQVKAGAAAAGVAGGSVDGTLYDVGRNAGRKLNQESDRFEQSLLVTDQQRRNVALQQQMSTKALTPKPSLLGALAGGAVSILEDRQSTVGSSGTRLNGAKQMEDETIWDRFATTMLG